MGRVLRLGPRRERGADPVARRHGVPPLGDDPGEARDAPRLERDARQPRVLPLAVQDVLTRSGVVSSIHSFTQSAIGPWFLGFIIVAVAFSTAMIWLRLRSSDDREARVARLARGGVPLQQPAPRRALPDDPVGDGVADRLRGGARRVGRRRPAVLRLLPADLRAPAAPADGDRPSSRGGAPRSAGSCAPSRGPRASPLHRHRARRAQGRVVDSGLIAYTFSAFVLAAIVVEFARGTAARRARTGEPVPTAFAQLVGPEPAAVRRLRRHAAVVLLAIGSRARARTTRCRRRLARGDSLSVGGYADLPRAHGARRRTRRRSVPSSTSDAGATIWERSRRARMRTASSNRCRTRSGSAPTSSPARISSSSPSRCATTAPSRLPRVRQAARQPHLARGDRVRAGLADRALAGPREERRLATRYARRSAPRRPRRRERLAPARGGARRRGRRRGRIAFLREPAPASDALHELDSRERELLEAEEERDRALAALKELEADHRAGRLSDQDYRSVVGPLRRRQRRRFARSTGSRQGRGGGAKGD